MFVTNLLLCFLRADILKKQKVILHITIDQQKREEVNTMKHPNGYGSVVKLSGNRRKPYAVRKTAGWNEKGYPVYLNIGYFSTKEEGLIALAEYNKLPWDIEREKTTLGELFELWQEKKAQKLGKSNQRNLKSAYKHIRCLENMKYNDIRSFHMQDCIDNCGYGYSTQWAIKNLWRHLDKFAFELDIIRKRYSEILTADSVPETNRIPFTDEEVEQLWKAENEPWVDSVLVFLYTGMRISELLGTETENVDLENGFIKGGIKTKAGKNRIIPIHPKIMGIVKKYVSAGNEYLLSIDGKRLSFASYYGFWNVIMKKYGMKHTPHECRHTFESRLDSAGANRRCIDLLMGHTSKDVGNRVYNHKTLKELKEAIEMIKK